MPFVFVIFERAFGGETVYSPYRSRFPWSSDKKAYFNGQDLQKDSNNKDILPPREADAAKSTPTLAALVASLGITDSAWITAVHQLATIKDSYPSGAPGQQRLVEVDEARAISIAIPMLQAIQDADAKNYHRAHVLLSDIALTIRETSPLRQRSGRDVFTRFFSEVPDAARFDDFAGRLGAYSAAQEQEVLLSGEHAAVLYAGGHKAAAEFLRDQLLSQLDLITLPMIDKAIQRGVSNGFRPPDRVVEIRDRLAAHAQTLRASAPAEGLEPYQSQAVAKAADAAYQTRFAAFEKIWKADAGASETDDAGVEKRLQELASSTRTVADWAREKAVVIRRAPLFTLRRPMAYRFLDLITPLKYDPKQPGFVPRDLTTVLVDGPGIAEPLAQWCKGSSMPESLADGSAHALLAWYWLESGRPELARASLVGGARWLLGRANAVSREGLLKLGEAAAGPLSDELNGYRFLMAASEIEAAPPGVVRGTGARYLAELAVLLASWENAWELCALPLLASKEVVDSISLQIEVSDLVASRRPESRERYYFNDYRFTHGTVPDVVVARALETNLFGPSGDTPPSGDAMATFFKSFTWPTAFSDGARERWKAPGKAN